MIYRAVVSEPKVPVIRVVAALIQSSGGDGVTRYLITQRRRGAALPLLWEFPGGRVEAGESDPVALGRELVERLGVTVKVRDLISYVSHSYSGYVVDLYLYRCELGAGQADELCAVGVQDFRWVPSTDFGSYAFTPADEVSMTKLLGMD